jgi:ribosomal protein L12E/L44/L45/RPP1/RPP2
MDRQDLDHLAAVLDSLPSPPLPLWQTAVGVEADAASVKRLLSELEGKSVDELLAAGRKQLQSVPSGGAVAAAAPAAGGAAAGGAAAAPAKKEEPSEEDEVRRVGTSLAPCGVKSLAGQQGLIVQQHCCSGSVLLHRGCTLRPFKTYVSFLTLAPPSTLPLQFQDMGFSLFD